MLKGLEKLKQKTESIPKYNATQMKRVESPIYVFDLNSELDANRITEICHNYQIDKYKEKTEASVYAWRSEYLNVADNHIPEFSELFSVVSSKIKLIWKMRYSFTIDHYWYAIYQKGDSAHVHDHGWIDFACVYYANVPEKSSPLVIPSLGDDIVVKPKTGQLVVFPGNCEHSVPVSNHEGERIIVAINVIRENLLGSDNTYSIE
jgi:hypothetical protein